MEQLKSSVKRKITTKTVAGVLDRDEWQNIKESPLPTSGTKRVRKKSKRESILSLHATHGVSAKYANDCFVLKCKVR